MFRIALAATLAIVIEAAYLQLSETRRINMKEACRDLSEIDCNNKVFCEWHFSGIGEHRRGRCR